MFKCKSKALEARSLPEAPEEEMFDRDLKLVPIITLWRVLCAYALRPVTMTLGNNIEPT